MHEQQRRNLDPLAKMLIIYCISLGRCQGMLYMYRPQGATLYEHSRTCISQREVSELIYDTNTLCFILILLQDRHSSPHQAMPCTCTVGFWNFSPVHSSLKESKMDPRVHWLMKLQTCALSHILDQFLKFDLYWSALIGIWDWSSMSWYYMKSAWCAPL